MMKQFFSLFLVLLLVLSCAAACAEGSDWDLAYSLMEKYTGYSRDQVRPGQLLYEDGMLSFSVVLKDHPEDEDGLLVFEMDGQNNLVSLEGPEKISLEQQLVAALKECFNREDCWQRLAGVHEKWSRKLALLSEEQKAEEIWDKYLRVIDLGITLPPEGALDYATAFDTALKQAAAARGWTEEMLRMYRPVISAYYVLDGSPVWFIYLETHSWFEKEYESDQAMNRYKAQLKEAFGAVGQKAPDKIGILIDAYTGALMERPMTDYIPVEFHYLDFLIRTEEAVESIRDL